MRDNRQMNENASHLQATGTLSLRSTDIDALGGAFFTQLHPTPLPDPYWVARSEVTTRQLGLSPNWMDGKDALALLVGNQVAQVPSPLATVYSGHQFGVWAGQLGDGRAIFARANSPRPGDPAQGRRSHALLPRWRWSRGAAQFDSRVFVQRSHAWAGNPHNASTVHRRIRPSHLSGGNRNGGRCHPRGPQLHSFWPLRAFLVPQSA
jgi:hypothetical protein